MNKYEWKQMDGNDKDWFFVNIQNGEIRTKVFKGQDGSWGTRSQTSDVKWVTAEHAMNAITEQCSRIDRGEEMYVAGVLAYIDARKAG